MPIDPDTPDADLIATYRKHGGRSEAGAAALRKLYSRHMEPLVDLLSRKISDPDTFFQVTRIPGGDALASSVFDKALERFQAGRGKFRTFLLRIADNRLRDGFRRLGRVGLRRVHPDEESGEVLPDGPRLDPHQQLVLAEIRALTCRCLKAMRYADRRRAFVWRELLDIGARELAGLWDEKSYDNIRQLHSRGAAEFLEVWKAAGGFDLADCAGAILEGRQEMGDPGRIRNAKNREAYQAWLAADHDLAAAAKKLGVVADTARRRVLDALEELLQVATVRGARPWEGVDFAGLAAAGDALGDYLEAGRERTRTWHELPANRRRLCDAVNRQLLVIRIALGLAEPERATQTLGGLLHERILADGPNAYDKWCKALRLEPAAFRRLLGDDLEVSNALLERLARRLGRPKQELRRRLAVGSDTRTSYRGAGRKTTVRRIRDHVLARRR